MKVGSLFAGIGGFDLGFERAGFEVAWCVEWDKAAQAVLRKRFPNAEVHGDIREVDPSQLAPVDVICGGFPCQDLSVAGKRAGLAGERSGLFHDAMRIVRRLKPAVLVLENVPGLLSSNRGLDFATVLREVGEGWDCAEVGWRVLDSQYFGVAQRRRRVFIVGSARAGCAEEVLALSEGGGGDPPSRGKARQGSSADAARCADVGRIVPSLTSKMAKGIGGPSGDECENLVVGTIDCDIPKQRVQNFCAGHWIPQAAWWDGSDCASTLKKQNANGSQRMPDKGNLGAVIQPFSPHGHYRYEASDQSATLQDRENRQGGHTHLIAQAFRKSKRAQSAEDDETWVDDGVANTLNGFDTGDARTTHAISFHPTQDPISDTERTHALGCGSKQVCATVGVCVTGDRTHSLTSNGADASEDGTGRGTPISIAFHQNQMGDIQTSNCGFTLGTTANATARNTPLAQVGMVVRRLTPVECERLQGFPDGWTQVGTDKPTADSHRYKQLGNAVTVNVAEWIARRVAKALTDGPKA